MFFSGTKKILGMNARNLLYIKPNNPGSAVRLADDKLATKKLLKKHKIPIVPMIDVFESVYDFEDFDWTVLPSSFVVKPCRGFGGEGIWVVKGLTKNGWKLSEGVIVGIDEIKEHIFDIFDGNYSLGNEPDVAYIEEKVRLHTRFKKFTYGGGIPDVRVVVYNMIPVMAMLRLPTEMSKGKANLRQGGIGVGIEIASGITTKAFWESKDKFITRYPGTKQKLNGVKIPYWREILEISSLCQKVSGLGYAGVDIVIDAKKGPMVLELNARPGLGIQNANVDFLKSRLERVSGLKVNSPTKAVRIARELFGEEIGLDLEKDNEKPVVGAVEEVVFFGKKGKKEKVLAKVDTGAFMTSIDNKVAEKLGLEKSKKRRKALSSLGEEWRDVYEIEVLIGKKKIKTNVSVADRRGLTYLAIIGRKDLTGFLVNPNKIKKV